MPHLAESAVVDESRIRARARDYETRVERARRTLERSVIDAARCGVHAVRECLEETRRGREALAVRTDAPVRLAVYQNLQYCYNPTCDLRE